MIAIGTEVLHARVTITAAAATTTAITTTTAAAAAAATTTTTTTTTTTATTAIYHELALIMAVKLNLLQSKCRSQPLFRLSHPK